MGEYAKLKGSGASIKIGTCEDMYYLRADQVHQVWAQPGNVDPVADQEHLRFRFPFPGEDDIAPGDFEDYDRGVTVWGVVAPEIDHHKVQFTAAAGYNVCLPCPESIEGKELQISTKCVVHRNGFRGAVRIVQQRVWEGHLALVCSCGGCGARYRCPELSDAQDVIDSLRAEAERKRRDDSPGGYDSGAFYETMAERIEEGYRNPPDWVRG